MEIRSTESARDNALKFSKRYLELLKQKKDLDADIKALKDEFKEEGVPVGVVVKALNKVKANKKKTDAERFEEEKIQDWIERDQDIDNSIGELNAK